MHQFLKCLLKFLFFHFYMQCCCRKAGKQIDEGNENDVYMTNSSYSVHNVVCPVSGMPVVELDDPVRRLNVLQFMK
jgi:hypothetical protein